MCAEIREVECKSALSRSGLPGLYYALNPYRGCTHACVYCYAPAIVRENRKWGSFLDVKTNIATVLTRELSRPSVKPGVVGIGTVTDPYQPEEEKYQLTRDCLKALLTRNFPVCIQTKSALVVRDIDIIRKFTTAEVGFTMTTTDEKLRSRYEGGSNLEEKTHAMKELSTAGVRVWVFIGPVLPGITDSDGSYEKIVDSVSHAGASYILVDRLRLKPGTYDAVKTFIATERPALSPLYEQLFKEGGAMQYYGTTLSRLKKLCHDHGIELRHAFGEQ